MFITTKSPERFRKFHSSQCPLRLLSSSRVKLPRIPEKVRLVKRRRMALPSKMSAPSEMASFNTWPYARMASWNPMAWVLTFTMRRNQNVFKRGGGKVFLWVFYGAKMSHLVVGRNRLVVFPYGNGLDLAGELLKFARLWDMLLDQQQATKGVSRLLKNDRKVFLQKKLIIQSSIRIIGSSSHQLEQLDHFENSLKRIGQRWMPMAHLREGLSG